MKKLRLLTAIALSALSLAGCGGGGGSEGTPPAPGSQTVISGMATKGPIDGTVSIYAIGADGAKGALLTTAAIANGSYSAGIGGYAGPVLIEVSGRYTDEATGERRDIPTGAPLRAAVSNASGTVAIPVTPLTDLAVRESGALTPTRIEAGNKLISDIFGFDIIKTAPVAPIQAKLENASQDQKDYTLALAAISQLSKDKGASLTQTLVEVASGIGSGGMDSATTTSYKSAAISFIMINPNNTTGIKDMSQTSIAEITGKVATTATFTLAIDGAPSAAAVYGIQFELLVPDGLTVKYDSASSTLLPGVVTESVSVAAVTPYVEAMFSTSTGVSVLSYALMSSNTGIGSGDLATLVCDTVAGFPPPVAAAFIVRNLKAVDENGATISGVTLTVR